MSTTAPNVRINGVNHLAISTADIKAQIEFFCEVLGAELVGLFWMHGVPDAFHAFCRLNDECSVSFVQLPAMAEVEPVLGVTHAGTGAGVTAPGTMQHVAFNVDTLDELLAMRDRIRSHGVNAIGHIDHGLCQSIYFAGPEGLVLEVATNPGPIDGDRWIDPEVCELAGISPADAARYRRPTPYGGEGGKVAQPPADPAKPHLGYPEKVYAAILARSDEQMTASASYANAPNDPIVGS